jgi:hypothetical protein
MLTFWPRALSHSAARSLGKDECHRPPTRQHGGIISARKQAALSAVLRSDLRVQRACARPFFPCELPRPSPALVSPMAFRRLSGASIHGKGLRVGASFSRPSVPDRHYFHERKLSEWVPLALRLAVPSTCEHFVGVRYTWAFVRSYASLVMSAWLTYANQSSAMGR